MINSVSDTPDNYSFYSALSHPPLRAAGNTPDLSIYRPQGIPEVGVFQYQAPAEGLLQIGGPHSSDTEWSSNFEIAWSKMGDKGPLVLFLHGVPTNRSQWEEVQGQVSRFCEIMHGSHWVVFCLILVKSASPMQY